MSTIQEQRLELESRFRDRVAVRVDDDLYSSHQLLPNDRNNRLFPVHDEAVRRLNSTMQRHIDGNTRVYETMIYKDQPREDLIARFWNGMINLPEFRDLPQEFQDLELEQAQKLGPTSRFTIEKLFDGFLSHVDEEVKSKNENLDEYEEAAKYFGEYLFEMCLSAIKKDPELIKYIKVFGGDYSSYVLNALPDDKAGGDPFFIRTDRKVSGTLANDLYLREARKIPEAEHRSVYYTMYSRIQNKGNSIVKGITPVTKIPDDPWLPEKNRVVQGDSRSWQFILKPYSDVLTQIPKTIDPIFVGWCDQDRKNEVFNNVLREYGGKVNFDSFDATEYDASTDPRNFALGIRIILGLVRRLCNYFKVKANLIDDELVIRHYLNDPTLTPWGAFYRDSTPSGHNFTGPNGTVTNLLRAYVQEARRRHVSFDELNRILKEHATKDIALFAAVGDDAFQLRDLDRDETSIAEENLHDGYTSNSKKVLLSRVMIHYLQFAYYWDGSRILLGYYPLSRVMEHALFQEKADQYSSLEVSTQATVQNLNNARYNPLLPYGVEFLMEGDVKYRLGAKVGVINLFKAASEGKTVAEFLGREWDPTYSDMTWDQYSEVLKPVVKLIDSIGRKYA